MSDLTTAALIRARGFIERGWCRGCYAKDADGYHVRATSPQAVEWCMVGALKAAGWNGNLDHPAALRLFDATGGRWAGFNDDQESVEPVLAAFDRAIGAGSGTDRSAPVGRAIAAGGR